MVERFACPFYLPVCSSGGNMHLRLFLVLCVIMCVFAYVCADCVVVLDHKPEHMCASSPGQVWQRDSSHIAVTVCCASLHLFAQALPWYSWLILALGLRVCCVCLDVCSYSMYSIRKHSTRSQETFLKDPGSHQHDNNTQPTHTAAADLSTTSQRCSVGIWWLWWF